MLIMISFCTATSQNNQGSQIVFSSVGDPWHLGADPDQYLWLMDPDPVLDPDPTPDPTFFFIDFKDATKKIIFTHFFLIICPQVHHLQSKKCNFLLKFCVKLKVLFCRHYFSLLNTFMRKGKWSRSRIRNSDKWCGSGSGRPKNMRILRLRIRIPPL